MGEKQSIELSGVQNARELGGYLSEDGRRVKQGVFLRTAKLFDGNEEDFRRLREVYRVAKIIDFRSIEEIENSPVMASISGNDLPCPDPQMEGVQYIHLPILDMEEMEQCVKGEFGEEIDMSDFFKMLGLMMEKGYVGDNMYLGFLDGALGKQSYGRFFQELLSLEEGRSVLFHCTQGKDRTGLAAMLILSALDVSEEIIIEDYMLTNEYYRDKIAGERKMLEMSGKVPADRMDEFLMIMDQVNEKTMYHVIAHLKEKYGSVKKYIMNGLGISEDAMERFKDRFLV